MITRINYYNSLIYLSLPPIDRPTACWTDRSSASASRSVYDIDQPALQSETNSALSLRKNLLLCIWIHIMKNQLSKLQIKNNNNFSDENRIIFRKQSNGSAQRFAIASRSLIFCIDKQPENELSCKCSVLGS